MMILQPAIAIQPSPPPSNQCGAVHPGLFLDVIQPVLPEDRSWLPKWLDKNGHARRRLMLREGGITVKILDQGLGVLLTAKNFCPTPQLSLPSRLHRLLTSINLLLFSPIRELLGLNTHKNLIFHQ